jgi:hypothetical protein
MAPAGKPRKESIMNDPDSVISSYERHRQARAELGKGNKAAVFDALAAANITEVYVEFDGEGDSGQIECVLAFHGDQRAELPATMVRVQNIAWGDAATPVTMESTLERAIETLCYDCLEEAQSGWENDGGAFGEFRLDVAERTIKLEFNARYTDTHTTNHTF